MRLPWGLSLVVDPSETIGRSICLSGVYDLALSEVLWRLADVGDTAVDVGANIGYTASILATKVGPCGLVYALEPHPDLYECLVGNVTQWHRELRAGKVTPISAAMADEEGTSWLLEPSEFRTNWGLSSLNVAGVENKGGRLHPVPVTTLDRVVGERRVGVLKIDVEGAEKKVLAGATTALQAGRIRDVVFEEHISDFPGPVADRLQQMGYKVFSIRKTMMGPQLVEGACVRRQGDYEPPSYLATKDVSRAVKLMRGRGWQCLRSSQGGRMSRASR